MEKEENLIWFNQVTDDLEDEVGKKAAFLSKIYKNGQLGNNVSVPEGFIIKKSKIKEFLEKNNITPAIENVFEETNFNDIEQIERASKQIEQLIFSSEFDENLKEEIFDSYENLGVNKSEIEKGSAFEILANSSEPVFVAVRTSDSDDLADSYFNVKSNSSIIKTMKKCLSSVFDPIKLKNYKIKNTKIDSVIPAIIIQKMIQSDKSGTVYISDELVVEAIWGMGAGLKQEEIEKDEYLVRKDSKVIKKEIRNKKYAILRDSSGTLRPIKLKEESSNAQVLTEADLLELSDAALRIEGLFNEKMKFDFAIESDEVSIVKVEKFDEKEIKIQPEEPIPETNFKKEQNEAEPKKENVEQVKEIKDNQEKLEVTKTKLELIISEGKNPDSETILKTKNAGLIKIEKLFENNELIKDYLQNKDVEKYENKLKEKLNEVTKNLVSAWVRLGNYSSSNLNEEKENNPLMGLKGIRYLLKYPEILKKELLAISSLTNNLKEVGILIPMVSSVYEIKKVKEFINNLGLKLKVGIILETPASIQLIKDFADEGIDKAIFSGNMLSQYLLAIDKNNQKVKEFFDLTNPALMYQIEYVIRVCKRHNIPASFYGDALKDYEMVEFLVKKEISSLLAKPQHLNSLNKKIILAEKKHIAGTDKEIRQYEVTKERERQLKELEEFEKMKEEKIQNEVELISKKDKATSSGKINENINFNFDKEQKNEQNEKVPEEKEQIEIPQDESPEEFEDRVEKDIEAIEEEKNAYSDKNENNEEEEFVGDDIVETDKDFIENEKEDENKTNPEPENNSDNNDDEFQKELKKEQKKIKIKEKDIEDPLGIF